MQLIAIMWIATVNDLLRPINTKPSMQISPKDSSIHLNEQKYWDISFMILYIPLN